MKDEKSDRDKRIKLLRMRDTHQTMIKVYRERCAEDWLPKRLAVQQEIIDCALAKQDELRAQQTTAPRELVDRLKKLQRVNRQLKGLKHAKEIRLYKRLMARINDMTEE